MREEFSEGLKRALKARDQRRTATLRAITAAIQDKDIAIRQENRGPATNEEILAIVQKMVKRREESFAIYAQAGRADLATVEKEEIDIL
ncbi:MAG: GatB/YqeY domain-containing protein, partial [Candidatus Devosia euplotis]|nr:GatB/YqeY domain-containing protein [Candidatus Devosia euplotis]